MVLVSRLNSTLGKKSYFYIYIMYRVYIFVRLTNIRVVLALVYVIVVNIIFVVISSMSNIVNSRLGSPMRNRAIAASSTPPILNFLATFSDSVPNARNSPAEPSSPTCITCNNYYIRPIFHFIFFMM